MRAHGQPPATEGRSFRGPTGIECEHRVNGVGDDVYGNLLRALGDSGRIWQVIGVVRLATSAQRII